MSTAEADSSFIDGGQCVGAPWRTSADRREPGGYRRSISLAVALALSGAVAPPPASAAAESPADAPSENQIQEVVVTAQKRSENQQNVPIAVSTVSGSQLD